MSSEAEKIIYNKDAQNNIFETDLIKKAKPQTKRVNIDDLIKDLRSEQKKDKRANFIISLILLACIGTVLFLFNYF